MALTPVEHLCAEWTSTNHQAPTEIRHFVSAFAEFHCATLAEHFYREMLEDANASQYLSNDQVQSRLSKSMNNWIAGLFNSNNEQEILRLIAEQRKIGEVHARIDIPVNLVLRGARCLKDRFVELLQNERDLPGEDKYIAMRLALATIDLAIEVMSQAYAKSHDRNARAEEAYRLFAITQNIAHEKDQQRAALFDWENQLMFSQAVGTHALEMPRIQASEFGLWFRHKGVHAFEGSSEADVVMEHMEEIDNVLIPLFSSAERETQIHLLRDLRDKVRGIRFHLDNLFKQNNELESGRDVLTRLLNRKFLPVVLSKQVSQARRQKASFAVLAIDIDHFKQVNDTYGHMAGDSVLQQLSLILVNNIRSGDYLFRMGGEEFLLIAVDVDAKQAARIAEKLRSRVEAEHFLMPDNQELHATISLGVACFEGHPDYQQLLRKSDDALYRAKHNGRNQFVMADA